VQSHITSRFCEVKLGLKPTSNTFSNLILSNEIIEHEIKYCIITFITLNVWLLCVIIIIIIICINI